VGSNPKEKETTMLRYGVYAAEVVESQAIPGSFSVGRLNRCVAEAGSERRARKLAEKIGLNNLTDKECAVVADRFESKGDLVFTVGKRV
jgi:hypothetical protein